MKRIPKVHQQELNPSNARITIEYKDKPEVTMEYVTVHHPLLLVFTTLYKYYFLRGIFLIPFIYVVLIKAIFFPEQTFLNAFIAMLLILDFVLLPFILVCFLFTYNKKLLALMPELNYRTGGTLYHATFPPSAVKNNQVELPLFNNIGLDYKAIGEMSKYLKKFEIIEHPFDMYVRGKYKGRNEYLWKAIWTFSEKPKTGGMVVRFK